MSDPRSDKRDLVLAPGSFAFMQDTTKGLVKTYVGPYSITPTAQERPVIYDSKTGEFRPVFSLEEAVRKSVVAVEGYYAILLNPAEGNKHPDEGSAQLTADLVVGRKIVVPGPINFALWPGQAADVIRGHHLRSNQYLLVRVYNEEEARRNWSSAIVKPVTPNPGAIKPGEEEVKEPLKVATAQPPQDLTIGKLLIIRGTEVSFYIPPTGVTVVQEENGEYVREALTLERLEYCILVDENGNKRFERGPAVVFPRPSEKFIEADGSKKFRAIELNPIQGIHIKVIADYEEGDRKYQAGEEIFITGKDAQIYYPREEHSAIKYDGKVKHFATAVPGGEGRYVMDRVSGKIATINGPSMLLPDPRTQVIVRRVLTDKECHLWYPGNAEAMNYNQQLRSVLSNVPTTRSGAISEGDYERNVKGAMRGAKAQEKAFYGEDRSLRSAAMNYASTQSFMESSGVSKDQKLVGEEFTRGSGYTQPRTVTLDTKYQGAPVINIWTGYAVQVVKKSDSTRRVVKGPATVLLDYDETLEVLEMSTGKPKTTDNLLRTAYLRTDNNKISDKVRVETSDHIPVELSLSYRVSFEGDAHKWFSVENYVKTLCDHARSVLKGAIRKQSIESFYADSTAIIQAALLAKDVMFFAENGMRLQDVEVLGVVITNESIRRVIEDSQLGVVLTTVDLATARRNLEVVKTKQSLKQEEAVALATTAKKEHSLATEVAEAELANILARLSNRLDSIAEEQKVVVEEQKIATIKTTEQLSREKATQEQAIALRDASQKLEIEKLIAEAKSQVDKLKALKEGMGEVMAGLTNTNMVTEIAKSLNLLNLFTDSSKSAQFLSDLAGVKGVGDLVAKLKSAPQNGAALAEGARPVAPR
jgi:major vault protein